MEKISRRGFVQISAIAGTALAGGGLAISLLRDKAQRIQETRTLMGTIINLSLVTDDVSEGRKTIAATFAEMQRLIALFDHRHAGTELAQLNATGSLAAASSELVEVLEHAVAISAFTDGAFDVSVKPLLNAYQQGRTPTQAEQDLVDYRSINVNAKQISFGRSGMAITLDGIAKGRVVDGAVQVLKNAGCANVLVEAGGDLLASGVREDGSAWRIGVTNPRDVQGDVLAVLPMSDAAMATSGDYMNAFSEDFSLNHIINPRTGTSPDELSSVTVLAPSATEADAYSTALMVLGIEQGLALVEELAGVEVLFVSKDQRQVRSSGFPQA